MRRLFVAAMALLCLSAPAVASHRDHHHHSSKASVHGRHYARHGGAWCGAYMRRVFGVADPRLNLARNWASVGSSAGGPHVGAVVVWAHHVGVIRGGPDASGRWLVESGNDGNAVRARAFGRCAAPLPFVTSAAGEPSRQVKGGLSARQGTALSGPATTRRCSPTNGAGGFASPRIGWRVASEASTIEIEPCLPSPATHALQEVMRSGNSFATRSERCELS